MQTSVRFSTGGDSGAARGHPALLFGFAWGCAEQPTAHRSARAVNLDEGDVYDWPWLYAVQPGHWHLTDAQADIHARISSPRRLLHGRRFLGPGRVGRLHGQHAARSFPSARSVELENRDPIFHTVYDLDDRYQVASEGSVQRGEAGNAKAVPTTGAASSTTTAA